MQVEVTPRSLVQGALAVVGIIAIASFARDALVGTSTNAVHPATTIAPFNLHPERDLELRKTNAFVAYVQCTAPVSEGTAELDGDAAFNGPIDVVRAFVEVPVFSPEGAVAMHVPGYRRQTLRWEGAVDRLATPCLPMPDWEPLAPHRVSAHLVTTEGRPQTDAHLSACGQYVEVDSNGAFAFEGGVAACAVQPFVRRAGSSVVGASVPYDPEASAPFADIVFQPIAVRLDHWQGRPADLELQLAHDGLVVTRALTPSPTSSDVFATTPLAGLPPGATITAVEGIRCADLPVQRKIELAEALGEPHTTYSIIQR